MNFYLQKYGVRPALIEKAPDPHLHLIVVIPAYKEVSVVDAINSLWQCAMPQKGVEVIVVFNQSEKSSKEVTAINVKAYDELERLKGRTQSIEVHVLKEFNLPAKHAGVGLARKIGMDEAVRRFELVNNSNGIIICYDADCTCDKNYLIEIERTFYNPKVKACSIYFEHPLEGNNEFQVKATEEYELHLRYYVNALRFAGHPHAFHTIGSSMAVRSSAYQSAGGMNKRKAGEDFYFLQKLIPNGGFVEINSTTVRPSCRISDRVPFGTGKAIGDALSTKEYSTLLTYNFEIFELLKILLQLAPGFYTGSVESMRSTIGELSTALLESLENLGLVERFNQIRFNVSSANQFKNRFYREFNLFQVLKLVHALTAYYPKSDVFQASQKLINKLPVQKQGSLLEQYRNLDKEGFSY